VFNELKIGTQLFFAIEPDNIHDPNAVAIHFYSSNLEKNTKLGYIPRDKNKEISQFLNCGYNNIFEILINRIVPEEHTEKQISVIVRIKLNENSTLSLKTKPQTAKGKRVKGV